MTQRCRVQFSVAVFVVGVSGFAGPVVAQEGWRTQPHVEALAADALGGRLTGSDGAQGAADYIVGQLRTIGATVLPGQSDFRLPFEFTAGIVDTGRELERQPEI